MGFVLFIIANTLFLPAFALSLIFDITRCLYKLNLRKGIKKVDAKFRELAVAIDIHGNVVGASLFNATLIHLNKAPVKFGRHGQTISAVLGYNQEEGTLRGTGKALCALLDFIDKDHCLKATLSDKSYNCT